MQENTQQTPIQKTSNWTSASETLNKAIQLAKKNYRAIVTVMALPLVLAILLEVLFGTDQTPGTPLNWAEIALGLVFIVAQYMAHISSIKIIAESNPSKSPTQYLAESKSLVLPYFWVSLLVSVAVVFGFILLIIPGFIAMLWFSLAQMVLVLENVRGINALKKSREYIKGYDWQVFKRFAFLVLVFIGLQIVISPLDSIFQSKILSNVAMYLLFVPTAVAYIYLTFAELKQIKAA